ncbi:hypothetical protein ROZALSC1DRAFT_28643 [Rozella allomycis CSF55]|uniref:Uncharacterized protein n=1 Tax=Rozella allomycis (strain CSF55) TaxID=988480 RepID=A0A075B493_ROZAC|nr:hypothetical protein O9G_005021 [Rozella allomycis CSF55]RKP19800.1 hypothetical protein ROZALSC1DRAFT_28643 [Rozella allomycis CSF55]|eukprot:EPZ36120.1 hypothetical protein O9G_005021 [Rozella allomycis CSF55]
MEGVGWFIFQDLRVKDMNLQEKYQSYVFAIDNSTLPTESKALYKVFAFLATKIQSYPDTIGNIIVAVCETNYRVKIVEELRKSFLSISLERACKNIAMNMTDDFIQYCIALFTYIYLDLLNGWILDESGNHLRHANGRRKSDMSCENIVETLLLLES